jgi:hypothetical protein
MKSSKLPVVVDESPATRKALQYVAKIGTGGGITKHPVPGAPSAWLAYVLVDDIAAAADKAKSLGATVMKPATEVMGMGWLSIIIDPTGAALGLWKPKPR